MIYFPWIVFLVGTALMIWLGFKARETLRKSDRLDRVERTAVRGTEQAQGKPERNHQGKPEIGGVLGGPDQGQGPTKWN